MDAIRDISDYNSVEELKKHSPTRFLQEAVVIAYMSIKDAARSKAVLFLALSQIALLILAGYLTHLSPGTSANILGHLSVFIVSAVSLSALLLYGLRTVYDDQNRREQHTWLNRISRESYLLGKLFGIIVTISLLVVWGMFCALLLVFIVEGHVAWGAVWVAYAIILRLAIISGIGLFFFTLNVDYPVNIILLLGIFIMGVSLNDAILSVNVLGKNIDNSYRTFINYISLLFPNLDLLDLGFGLTNKSETALSRAALDTAYCLSYTAAALFASLFFWKQKDL